MYSDPNLPQHVDGRRMMARKLHSQSVCFTPDGTALGYTLMYFTHNHSLASQGDPRNSHGANVWKNTV